MAKVVQENGTFVIRDDWHIEDILLVAANMDVEMSYAQVVEVMYVIEKAFDANLGINWLVIENAIQEVTS